MFRPEDTVICINAIPGTGTVIGVYDFPGGYLVKGEIYRIADVREVTIELDLQTMVTLIGCPAISNEGPMKGFDLGFQASRFRKTSELTKEERMSLVQPKPVKA